MADARAQRLLAGSAGVLSGVAPAGRGDRLCFDLAWRSAPKVASTQRSATVGPGSRRLGVRGAGVCTYRLGAQPLRALYAVPPSYRGNGWWHTAVELVEARQAWRASGFDVGALFCRRGHRPLALQDNLCLQVAHLRARVELVSGES